MSSVDRTMEKALADVRDEIARASPLPEWTVLVVERATPEEIEAASKSLAAIRAALPVLRTITNRRKLTPRQRRARAIFAEHDPVVRAFAERYSLRVTDDGAFDFDAASAPPWSGPLERDRPYHVAQRVKEPSDSGGLILWTVVPPDSLSDEERALAEAREERRKKMIEGAAEPAGEVELPAVEATSDEPSPAAEPEPSPGAERSARWQAQRDQLMRDVRESTPATDFQRALRQGRATCRVMPLFNNPTRRRT